MKKKPRVFKREDQVTVREGNCLSIAYYMLKVIDETGIIHGLLVSEWFKAHQNSSLKEEISAFEKKHRLVKCEITGNSDNIVIVTVKKRAWWKRKE